MATTGYVDVDGKVCNYGDDLKSEIVFWWEEIGNLGLWVVFVADYDVDVKDLTSDDSKWTL